MTTLVEVDSSEVLTHPIFLLRSFKRRAGPELLGLELLVMRFTSHHFALIILCNVVCVVVRFLCVSKLLALPLWKKTLHLHWVLHTLPLLLP